MRPAQIAKANCKRLAESNRTFEDVFNVLFSQKGIVAEQGNEIYSFEEARNEVSLTAGAINKLTDGQTDTFIALDCPNCYEWIVLFWAIMKSGNKPLLVNARQPDSSTVSILNTMNVSLVLRLNTEKDHGRKVLTYSEIKKNRCALPDGIGFGNAMALSTSGTTLNEKICVYSGEEIVAQILNSDQLTERNRTFGASYKGKAKILAVLPLYHIFGLEASSLWYTFFGATLVFPEQISASVVTETVREHKVTHIFAVPMLWSGIEKSLLRQLNEQGDKTVNKFNKAKKLSVKLQNISPALGIAFARIAFKKIRRRTFGDSVRFCITGGSHVSAETLETLSAIGYPLYNGYGMTEIGIASVDFSPKPKDRIPVTIGTPFSSAEFAVSPEGSLLVKGSSVCKRIIINGKETLFDAWFDTDDLVKKDEKGKYTICGRRSELIINESGENLNPHLAQEMLSIPLARDFAVIGDEKNENPVLVVQYSDTASDDEKSALADQVSKALATLPTVYSVKETLYTVDAIMDKNDIKISRAKLRARINDGSIRTSTSIFQNSTEDEGEETEIKKALRSMFAFYLGKKEEEIPSRAHFMNELGGTSLDYMSVICEAEREFGVKLKFEADDSFGYSLNDLARKIEELTDI